MPLVRLSPPVASGPGHMRSSSERIVFDPRYATPFASGSLGPPRGTPETLAVIWRDGRVLVLEGMHKLELAQLGAFPADAGGRIPGWPW